MKMSTASFKKAFQNKIKTIKIIQKKINTQNTTLKTKANQKEVKIPK